MTRDAGKAKSADPQFRAWETATVGLGLSAAFAVAIVSGGASPLGLAGAALFFLAMLAATYADVRAGGRMPASICWWVVLGLPVLLLEWGRVADAFSAWTFLPLALAWPGAASRLWHARDEGGAMLRKPHYMASMSWLILSLAAAGGLTWYLASTGWAQSGILGFLLFMVLWGPTIKFGGPAWLERLLARLPWTEGE